MKRRNFLTLTGASMLALSVPQIAAADGWVDYSKADPISAALAEGKTVLVDYAAEWCSTCAAQERVINSLRKSNPEYDSNIVFVRVDWDRYGRKPVTRDRNIPRRSTLIVLKGNQELGRLVAGTSKSQIKQLMDTALSAATS